MRKRAYRIRTTHKVFFLYCVLLRLAVTGLLIWKLLARQWSHAGFCVLTLLLFSLPAFLEALASVRIPVLLEVVVTLFAVSANICGEMLELYLRVPWWDAALHVSWGFLAAALGCACIDIFEQKPGAAAALSPMLAAVFALSFAVMSGVLWEFFEYFMDSVFHMDMQKDAFIHSIHSVLLNPEGKNIPVALQIRSVAVNGEAWPGMLDTGLTDTMEDQLLNFAGALVFSALDYLHLRNKGKIPFLRGLMPYRV